MTAELGIAEAGYLARGRRRAMVAALVALRVSGAVVSSRKGTIRQRGTPPSWADPLTRAVFRAVSRPGDIRAIKARMSVQQALGALRKDLVARKLVLPVWRRLLPVVLLAGAGGVLFARLPWAALGAGVLAVVALRWPRRTWAGRRELRRLRGEWPDPDEDDEPADAWGTGMVVALHGRLDLDNIAVFTELALSGGGTWPDYSAGDSVNRNDRMAIDGGMDGHSLP
jgi:uncharacterized protein (TIGR04222 family)